MIDGFQAFFFLHSALWIPRKESIYFRLHIGGILRNEFINFIHWYKTGGISIVNFVDRLSRIKTEEVRTKIKPKKEKLQFSVENDSDPETPFKKGYQWNISRN